MVGVDKVHVPIGCRCSALRGEIVNAYTHTILYLVLFISNSSNLPYIPYNTIYNSSSKAGPSKS